MAEPKTVMTTKDVQSILHISRDALYKLDKSGKLRPITKKGGKNYYRVSDVVKLIKKI